jgi:cell filamentation protein, protein adenylyltransferase
MIEHTDITILGTTTLKNKLGITDPHQLGTAEADLTAFRLAELRTAPVRGGFDSLHLQEIHHHVYQDLYDWAGELRRVDSANQHTPEVATSLNAIFDRLGRENHLKGRSPEAWSHSASTYIYDIGTIQPFLAGNGVALREFADELARKNNLSLEWDRASEIGTRDLMRHLDQSEQSANIRRMVMLAMDNDPGRLRPGPGNVIERAIERIFLAGNPWL